MNATAESASAVLFVTVFAVVCCRLPGEAHKGVTSKFTYNAEVYPIFLNRCGHCHVTGGVGPMSLVSYEDAFPWAESLRTELLDTESARAGESDSFIRAAHRDVPARELDVIVDDQLRAEALAQVAQGARLLVGNDPAEDDFGARRFEAEDVDALRDPQPVAQLDERRVVLVAGENAGVLACGPDAPSRSLDRFL